MKVLASYLLRQHSRDMWPIWAQGIITVEDGHIMSLSVGMKLGMDLIFNEQVACNVWPKVPYQPVTGGKFIQLERNYRLHQTEQHYCLATINWDLYYHPCERFFWTSLWGKRPSTPEQCAHVQAALFCGVPQILTALAHAEQSEPAMVYKVVPMAETIGRATWQILQPFFSPGHYDDYLE